MVADSGRGNFESRLAVGVMERNFHGQQNQEGTLNPFVGIRDYNESSNTLDSLVDGVQFNTPTSNVSRSLFIEEVVRENRKGGRVVEVAPSFKPAITAKATALPARSFEEMSIGDSRRREVAVRKVLAQNAKKEEQDLTLRPRLTKMAIKSPSHLRLHEADSYTVCM
jgi:hypothetical protein